MVPWVRKKEAKSVATLLLRVVFCLFQMLTELMMRVWEQDLGAAPSSKISGKPLLALRETLSSQRNGRAWRQCSIAHWKEFLLTCILKTRISFLSSCKMQMTMYVRLATRSTYIYFYQPTSSVACAISSYWFTLCLLLFLLFLLKAYLEGALPRLQFRLDETAIVVLNNEVGFSEANIRALCNVGNSTKGNGGVGYIGQKGIGFKSVFAVSDSPCIHSNGYHFKLDARHKVIPEWIEEGAVPKVAKQNRAQTIITLPLNDKMVQRSSYLSTKFEDITPILLMFLNKLRSLLVVDSISGNERDMNRIDHPNGVCELSTNGESEKFSVEAHPRGSSRNRTE
jgi:hypothetical protein